MATYYLKTAEGTRMYRLEYVADEGRISLALPVHACATGTAAILPNGDTITLLDQAVDVAQAFIDHILHGLVVGTVAEYRTLAKAMVDGKWY